MKFLFSQGRERVQVFQMGYHQCFWHIGGHTSTGLWVPLDFPEVACELSFFFESQVLLCVEKAMCPFLFVLLKGIVKDLGC